MNRSLLQNIVEAQPDLELAVLVGSRASETADCESDWDIAIQWRRETGFLAQLDATERLRQALADALNVPGDRIDLIDLPTASLAMRAVVAEEGRILTGAESLAWHHFLQRTWRELEEYYWDDIYAA